MRHSVLLLLAATLHAQRHEVGLTLGRASSPGLSGVSLEAGNALQANYGRRLYRGENIEVFGEAHFLTTPLRQVASPNRDLTRDVAAIFVTPGVRVKWRPRARWSPYVAAGGGLASFEQSLLRLNGAANPVPRTISRGALDFGAGIDVPLWRFIGMRAEVRDFYSGLPAYGLSSLRGGQHTVVAGGGFVLRFR
ncbi:MAG: hypothetical protein U0Q18_00455 [Bryobacteraceae bacterium]